MSGDFFQLQNIVILHQLIYSSFIKAPFTYVDRMNAL